MKNKKLKPEDYKLVVDHHRQEIAEACNVSLSYVGKILEGRRYINSPKAKKVALLAEIRRDALQKASRTINKKTEQVLTESDAD